MRLDMSWWGSREVKYFQNTWSRKMVYMEIKWQQFQHNKILFPNTELKHWLTWSLCWLPLQHPQVQLTLRVLHGIYSNTCGFLSNLNYLVTQNGACERQMAAILEHTGPYPQRRIKIGELPEHCEGFPCNIHWPTLPYVSYIEIAKKPAVLVSFKPLSKFICSNSYTGKVVFSQHWIKTIESPEAGAGFLCNIHLSN